jgi:hypothetical protein
MPRTWGAGLPLPSSLHVCYPEAAILLTRVCESSEPALRDKVMRSRFSTLCGNHLLQRIKSACEIG